MKPLHFHTALQVLLLAALIESIVYASSELLVSRRDRSPYIDTSQASPNANPDDSRHMAADILTDNRSAGNESHSQSQSPIEKGNARRVDEYSDYGIFAVGPGFKLFNNTLETDINQVAPPPPTPQPPQPPQPPPITTHMQNDDAFTHKPSTEAQTFKNTPQDQQKTKMPDVVFPGPTSSRQDRCDESALFKGQRFCTKVHDYPKLDVRERNKLNTEFSQLFGEDLAQPPTISTAQRNSFGVVPVPPNDYLCQSREQIVYPNKGLTKDNVWLHIVNDEEYKQGIRIEWCSDEGKQCEFADLFPSNYNPICKQFYVFRQLVAITANKTVQKEYFQMPSCCKCSLNYKNP